jgi:hypothetical protein
LSKGEVKIMDKEQKNQDFIQIYRSHIDDITRLAGENYTAFKLLQLLIKHMDGVNALCVSNVALMEVMGGVSRATVTRSVKYLRDNGWICVLKTGSSNVYIVNPEIAWTSYGNQKSYCRFQSSVLLSSSENNEFLNNPRATTHFKTVDIGFIKSVQEKREQFEKNNKDINNEQLPGQLEIDEYLEECYESHMAFIDDVQSPRDNL